MEKKMTTPVVAGLVISMILIVFSLVVYFTGLYTETWNQYVGVAILVTGIIWAVYNHGKENGFYAGFGKLFGFGFKTTAVIVCIMIVWTLLSGFFFPEIKEKMIEMSRENALSQPNANAAQVEQGIEMFAKNYTLFIVIGLLFWNLIAGALSALIGAAITKKKPVDPFERI